VALPFIRGEFNISNLEAGAVASFFFLGYAISQIPAGLWFGKFGIRGLVSLSAIGFSLFTFLIGTSNSIAMIKWLRLGLGLSEGPTPVGCTSAINNWFPPKEKATAVGVYIASTMFAPIVVPLICVGIAQAYGWRSIFYIFSIPGFVMAALWYWLLRNKPEMSPHVNAEEVAYINEGKVAGSAAAKAEAGSLGWMDKLIRAKSVVKIENVKGVFTSWNIWADCLAYFMMVSVLYGLMTWIPSYLVNEKHYSFIKMGFVAASPWVGGLLGAILGGWISDKLLHKRRKPTMLFTALSTGLMMIVLVNIPENTYLVSLSLFMTGFLLNIGWPAFTAYPMGLTNSATYPVAIAVVNSGGNLGGFFSPMIAGALLDAFKSYSYVFGFFGVAAALGLLLIFTLDEPVN
jgi:sugar phosphate permease